MLVIRKCNLVEIENTPNFNDLVEEYDNEVRVDGTPPIAVKKEIYFNLEKLGVFQFFGAYLDDVLIGFITVLSTVFPHRGVVMSVSESFFVAKEYRKTGAGIKLRTAAEKYVEEIGSPGLFVSTPTGGDLEYVMSNSKEYIETNRVFFRRSKNVK